MALRNYSNTAPPQALTATLVAGSGAQTVTVASTTGYPSPPFILGLERGTGNQEVALCTALTSTTFTVTRGFDGTPTPQHNIGAAVEHTSAAIDYREANALVNTLTTLGDIMIFGPSGNTRLPLPSGSTVGIGLALMADSSQANGMAWEQVIPTGIVMAAAGSSAPAGFFLCQGQAVSRTTYNNLWTYLGKTASPWGQGDGSTTFNVPNLQGMTIIGVGTGHDINGSAKAVNLGTLYGEYLHTLSLAEMPSHNHVINISDNGHQHGGVGGYQFMMDVPGSTDHLPMDSGSWGVSFSQFTGSSGANISANSNNTGSSGSHNTIQPGYGLNWIIKF